MLARLGLWLLPRLAWVTFLVIILVWAILVEGGFGFDESSVFGWHALFMTLGFVVFLGESLLAYNAPLHHPGASASSAPSRLASHPVRKSFHVIWHLLTLVCAVLGLVGIVYYKSLSDQPVQFPFFTMYSVHSWLGVSTLALWGFQFISKTWHHFSHMGKSADEKQAFLTFHRYLGRCVFVSGLATAALGLQDMQSSDLAGLGYGPFSTYSLLAPAGGLVLLVLGMSVFATFVIFKQGRNDGGNSSSDEEKSSAF